MYLQGCDVIALEILLDNADQVSLGEIQMNPQEWIDEIDQCGSVMEKIITNCRVISSDRLRKISE